MDDKLAKLKAITKDLSVLYVEDESQLRETVSVYLAKLFDTVL